jgi:hypothetical protein
MPGYSNLAWEGWVNLSAHAVHDVLHYAAGKKDRMAGTKPDHDGGERIALQ